MKNRLGSIRPFAFTLCLLLFGFGFFWCMPCEANWSRTYGGTAFDNTYSIQQTADGGYIVAGQTDSFGAGNSDVWLVKLAANGDVVWQKTYGGTLWDTGYSVRQTADGGYIVAGQIKSLDTSDDAWILKLDSNGDATWQKTYGGTLTDAAYFAQQTADGGYIVAGATRSFGAGDQDVWILKLDSSGNVTWQTTYGGTALDTTTFIQQTADGGYIVVGGTRSFGAGDYDAWLVKLDSNGNITWQKTYGGTGSDFAYHAQQTQDGGYIVTGGTRSFGSGNYDVWLLKLNAGGDVTWQKTYGGTGYDYAYSVQQTADAGYILTGETDSFGAGDNDAWLLKLDSNGNITWQKTYGGTGYDYAYDVKQTLDGGYVLTGGSGSFGAGGNDAWTMKLDENGSTGTCPFEGISTAIISDTMVTGTETDAITSTTTVIGVNTTIDPIDSTVTPSTVCPLSDKPLVLKTGATRKRHGEGTILSSDGLIDCPETCQALYNPGVTVTLSATPSPLSTFMGWKPASLECEGTDPCTVTMDKKKSVKAVFQGPNKLKVVSTLKKGATGTVTSGDGLINCPGDCDEQYILNAPVTLTATAGDGSSFVKWTGRPCKEVLTNECTFTMDKNATVKAIFQTNPE